MGVKEELLTKVGSRIEESPKSVTNTEADAEALSARDLKLDPACRGMDPELTPSGALRVWWLWFSKFDWRNPYKSHRCRSCEIRPSKKRQDE